MNESLINATLPVVKGYGESAINNTLGFVGYLHNVTGLDPTIIGILVIACLFMLFKWKATGIIIIVFISIFVWLAMNGGLGAL